LNTKEKVPKRKKVVFLKGFKFASGDAQWAKLKEIKLTCNSFEELFDE